MGAGRWLILGLALLSLALSGVALWQDEPLAWRFARPLPVAAQDGPLFQKVLDYTAPAGEAHSPSIIAAGAGFSVLWFEGSKEAGVDVDIQASQISRAGAGWHSTEPAPYMTRDRLRAIFEPRQRVVTLGNTAQNDAMPGHVFATVVSVGGWAMAAVADVKMAGDGPVWARKLNLSPILNRSFLVKSPMVAYAGGGYALPAYFEMGAAYGALVRFGRGGRVRDVRRIAGPGRLIQPMIVPLSDTRAVSFLRDLGPSRRLWVSHTEDGGERWSRAQVTELPNPGAPVAALPLRDGRILMAMNDDADRADRLRLAVSQDEGESWRVIHTLEEGGGDARYPVLRRLEDGTIALAYSHGGKRGIRAFVLNDAWVEAR